MGAGKKKKKTTKGKGLMLSKNTFQQDSSSGCYLVNKALSNYDIN